MRTTLNRTAGLALLTAALTAVGSFSVPAPTSGFALLGGLLNLTQRDFRVFNNFNDPEANNNTTTHPNFPGATGAVQSIWKAHAEWASGPYAGNGLGDPTAGNSVLGNGDANFDNTFQGLATSVGTTNQNIHSELNQTNNGVFAFMEGPISDGWRIRYYRDPWVWQDGPGTPGSGSDIQGIATHEIGHSLGLDHSNEPCATMISGCGGTCIGERSICFDDIAGVQAIYGAKANDKPEITSLGGSKDIGGTLIINGANFDATDNEVWFTRASSNGVASKVFNVNSSAGGTQISVTIPNDAIDGEVTVKRDGNFVFDLSNSFPIDIGSGVGNPPFISQLDPAFGQAGGFEEITITGIGFSGTSSVTFDGNPSPSFTIDSDSQITALSAPGSSSTSVDVTVTNSVASDTAINAFSYIFNNPPDIDTVTPNSGDEAGGTLVQVSGNSVVGVSDVKFDGVSASAISVIDAQTLECITPPGTGTVDVRIEISDALLGLDNDTIAGGYTYTSGVGGAFVQYGTGSGGAAGVPDLDGAGDLTPGGAGFTIDVTNGLASAPVTLVVGVSDASLALKGQTLLVFPILLQIPLPPLDGSGALSLPASIPGGTPTASIYMQAWIVDATGVKGLSSTNGLRLDIP